MYGRQSGFKKSNYFFEEKKNWRFWTLGTGSEDMNLSFQKRVRIAQIISTENAGDLPLVIGASFFCLEETLNYIEETKNLNFLTPIM